MDAVKYLKEKNRMTFKGAKIFETIHNGRRKSLGAIEDDDPEGAVEIVEKWSLEHPQKTMMSDFFEKHPNAKKDGKDEPTICPFVLGYTKDRHCYGKNCFDCWNRPLEG